MRAILVKGVWLVAVLAGLAAAIAWGSFIWSFDWGESYRGRGLWGMTLFFGALVAFAGGLIVAFIVLCLVWEAIFRQKFPS